MATNLHPEEFRMSPAAHKAVALHDPTYCAYYYLAHASFMAGAWAEAASWFEQALVRQPNQRIKPAILVLLLVWAKLSTTVGLPMRTLRGSPATVAFWYPRKHVHREPARRLLRPSSRGFTFARGVTR